MAEYLTELHCHSGDVSNCAEASAEYITERYVEAGYKTVVLTNHLSIHTYIGNAKRYPAYLERTGKSDCWESKIDFFMTGYENLKKAAEGKLNVIFGMEYRPLDSDKYGNEYLVYGVTEEFLRAHGELPDLRLKEFCTLFHENGMMIYQAHPFRTDMKITTYKYFDGIEVYNGAISHDSRNGIADLWADRYSLGKVSGTDFHRSEHIIDGGIETECEIVTSDDLLSVLRSGNYSLIRKESSLL